MHNQLARANIHQLMIGRLETEQRVASFILDLALRDLREGTPGISVALPMSRTDIANYLVINCDTLSRTMMKFCDYGLLERENRHAIRVVDLDALKKKIPSCIVVVSSIRKGGAGAQVSALDATRKESRLHAFGPRKIMASYLWCEQPKLCRTPVRAILMTGGVVDASENGRCVVSLVSWVEGRPPLRFWMR